MDAMQHAKILNALTNYDRRQSRSKHYNRFAFGQYCGALIRAQEMCDEGADIRLALLNCFNGRLLDVTLKAVDLPLATREEHRGQFVDLP